MRRFPTEHERVVSSALYLSDWRAMNKERVPLR